MPVDNGGMARALGLISLLVTLAVVGYLFTRPAGEAAAPPEDNLAAAMAEDVAAQSTLLVPRTGVESYFATSGTYAGAPVPSEVTLSRADAASYCLQVGAGTAVLHLAGPGGGSPEPGPC